MIRRIIANLTSIAAVIYFLVSTSYDNSLQFIVFTLPYILSNTAVFIMLMLSLFNKPKDVGKGISQFLISVIGTNLGVIVGLIGIDLFNPVRNIELSNGASFMMILTIPFYIVAVFTLGRNLTVLPEANKLKTTGVYSISRHPLYATYVFWYVLQILMCQSWISVILSAAQITLQIMRAKNEEEILSKNFPEYEEYKNRVGWYGRKLIPKGH